MKRFESHLMLNQNLSVDDVLLEPTYGCVLSRNEIELTDNLFYSAPMDRVTDAVMAQAMLAQHQMPVIARCFVTTDVIQQFRDTVFYAISAKPKDIAYFFALLDAAQIDCQVNVAIDIAHGYSKTAFDALEILRHDKRIDQVMTGSIATAEAAKVCAQKGFTHLRVGIGSGSMCTTRLMTGVGVPQLTAIYKIAQALQHNAYRPVIISDGGIRYPGDVVKYLAAGADAVMMGGVFSKCNEAPGWWLDNDGKKVKNLRGHASSAYQEDAYGFRPKCAEGISSDIFESHDISVKDVIDEFNGGIASGLSYLGMSKLSELKCDAVEWQRITTSTHLESLPRKQL